VRSRDCRLGRMRKDKPHNPPPPKSPSLTTITSSGYKTCGPKRGTSGQIPRSSRRARGDFGIAYLRPLCGGDMTPAINDEVPVPVPLLEAVTASTADRTEACKWRVYAMDALRRARSATQAIAKPTKTDGSGTGVDHITASDLPVPLSYAVPVI
jgi:hypothetical protein